MSLSTCASNVTGSVVVSIFPLASYPNVPVTVILIPSMSNTLLLLLISIAPAPSPKSTLIVASSPALNLEEATLSPFAFVGGFPFASVTVLS